MSTQQTPTEGVDRAALERALAEAPGGADALRGRLLLDLARARVRDWDVRALPAARRGVDLVAHVAEVEPADLLTLGDACLLRRLPEALDRYREAGDLGAGGDASCAAACGEAQALDALGHPHEAMLAAQTAEMLATELRLPDRVAQARWIRLRVHVAIHGPDAAILEALDTLIRKAGDAEWTELAAVDLAVGLADAGRGNEARCVVDRVLSRPRTGAARQAARWAVGELEWLSGRPDRAAAEAETLLERWPDSPIRAFAEVTLAWARLDQGLSPQPPSIRFLDAPAGLDELATAAAMALGEHHETEGAERRFRRSAQRLSGRMVREELRSLLGAAHAAERGGCGERARRLRAAVAARAGKAGLQVLATRAVAAGEDAATGRATTASPLSGSEQAVLRLVAKGLTSREIAERRGVSRATIETQVRSATGKLGARNRRQAAAQFGEPEIVAKVGEVPQAEALQMLALVAAGAGVEDIAARSAYSPRTVARRLASVRRALGARTTAQAISLARARGLLGDEAVAPLSAASSRGPGTTSRG